MKRIFLALVLFSSISLGAQSCFTYDAAGNRTKRSTCVSSLTTQENQELQALFKDKLEPRSITIENDLENFIVYPNPSSGTFQISDSKNWIGSQIMVYSTDGKLIHSGQITDQAIDLLFLPNGIYFLSVRRENVIKTAKLFINK